eukprot:CAMPEP_0201570304 /NCGR_PEP_ID=MMETSP0190_2-20130828/12510_1 /ASSEMBLY_ACC=CAM_ASM_000263 /TAXON_ID=37353 /ORGANISM="Rosalina sp." /LENGTH=100 /DNA_ID=CAMNT_0047993709 /DNA_START=88 /DNA_END=387 /DNA_ORIENTATION=-
MFWIIILLLQFTSFPPIIHGQTPGPIHIAPTTEAPTASPSQATSGRRTQSPTNDESITDPSLGQNVYIGSVELLYDANGRPRTSLKLTIDYDNDKVEIIY